MSARAVTTRLLDSGRLQLAPVGAGKLPPVRMAVRAHGDPLKQVRPTGVAVAAAGGRVERVESRQTQGAGRRAGGWPPTAVYRSLATDHGGG